LIHALDIFKNTFNHQMSKLMLNAEKVIA